MSFRRDLADAITTPNARAAVIGEPPPTDPNARSVMTETLHDQRIEAVRARVLAAAPRTVLDLGCGPGPLLRKLAQDEGLDRIVGVDEDRAVIERLRAALPRQSPARAPSIDLIAASITDLDASLVDFDMALLVEVIEHMTIDALRRSARVVFGMLRPRNVIVTTPNVEFNHLLGVPSRRRRHPGHRFEWTRAEFAEWCAAICETHSYDVERSDLCGAHGVYGGATQLGLFCLRTT